MDATRKAKRGALGAALLAALMAVTGYALTNQITIPTNSNAGDGEQPVAAIAVTNVHYGLNSTNPDRVSAIEFNLSVPIASGGRVWIQPVDAAATPTGGSTAGAWYSCVLTGSPIIDTVTYTATASHPVCNTTTPQLAAIDINQVRVVAAD